MSPHQSFPLWYRMPDKAQGWVTVSTKCYVMLNQAKYSRNTGDKISSNVATMMHVSGYGTAKYYTTASSSYSVHSHWSCSRLHGSPPTYRLGLPPDKDAECPRLLIPPVGRDDPPDKEITYNRMNGSPGDPPGTVMHQSKQQKNRSFHNPSRGRSIRQGGRMGDNYRRYQTCH